jgi:hypothetical protein
LAESRKVPIGISLKLFFLERIGKANSEFISWGDGKLEKSHDQIVVACPGCGLQLDNQHFTPSAGYHASAECYQKYSELSSYTIGKQDIHFMHQHAVDTYAAQHSGNGMKNITTAFSLIGLYFAIEHGYNGRQVQRVHTLLARKKYAWAALQPPEKSAYSLTVCDVLKEQPGESRDRMLRNWMYDVWECWGHQHDWVKNICHKLLK